MGLLFGQACKGNNRGGASSHWSRRNSAAEASCVWAGCNGKRKRACEDLAGCAAGQRGME